MLDFIYRVYIDYLWTPLVYLTEYFENNQLGVYVLIIILIVSVTIQNKIIKNNRTRLSFISAPDEMQNVVKRPLVVKIPIHIGILGQIITLFNLTLAALIIGICARYVLIRS
jgi:hypothetical protein